MRNGINYELKTAIIYLFSNSSIYSHSNRDIPNYSEKASALLVTDVTMSLGEFAYLRCL